MTVFLDTSACYALVSATDNDHAKAREIYTDLVERREPMVTSSYVLAESMGLIQHRLGWKPLERFATAAATWEVAWIDAERHRKAEALLFQHRRRAINIVDAASFVVMRELGIDRAFAFDDDFEREGFDITP